MRRPDGYVGKDHETIGSDLLAVLAALQQLSEAGGARKSSLPEQIIGPEMSRRLKSVKPDGWYPIAWLLEMMDTLDAKVGRYVLLKMGRTLFRMSHRERVVKVASSARDIIHGIDGMYHHANRGEEIGGWQVLKFEPGYAELRKTTPHHCAMEEGILSEALSAVGAPSIVEQRECFREGAGACLFVITSTVVDRRWTG